MKSYLIEDETPAEAVKNFNALLKHFENKPVSVAWKGDLTGAVITSNYEPESLEEKPVKKGKKTQPETEEKPEE